MRKFLLLVLLLAGSSLHGFAQADCFVYEDVGKTIMGLTAAGQTAATLTIPKEVTTVRSGAFSSAANASALIIENGGNPAFEPNLFGTTEVSDIEEPNANRLSDIQILGSSMTVANIRALFTSLVAQGALTTVYIEGYSGDWIDIPVSEESPSEADVALLSVLTNEVTVTMPAALVSTQQFGNAEVCGRFVFRNTISTYSGNATFLDSDDGSNWLFYIPIEYQKENKQVYVKRVHYIKKGEGVLLHNIKYTSEYVDIVRVAEDLPNTTTGNNDESNYSKNMLVGLPGGGEVNETDGDYTNFVLSQGTFHPTSGGNLKPNRAYLRMLTSDWEEIKNNSPQNEAKLGIAYGDDATEISTLDNWTISPFDNAPIYNLAGQKVSKSYKGIVIQNGKKYVVR